MNGPCNKNVGPCNPNVGSWYFQWYFETWKTVERAVRGIVRYRNKGLICQSDAVLSGQIVKGGSSKQNVNIFWRSCQNSPSFSSLGCDRVMIVGAGVIVFSRRFINGNSDERTSKRCSATYERKRTCLWKSRWFHIVRDIRTIALWFWSKCRSCSHRRLHFEADIRGTYSDEDRGVYFFVGSLGLGAPVDLADEETPIVIAHWHDMRHNTIPVICNRPWSAPRDQSAPRVMQLETLNANDAVVRENAHQLW